MHTAELHAHPEPDLAKACGRKSSANQYAQTRVCCHPAALSRINQRQETYQIPTWYDYVSRLLLYIYIEHLDQVVS